MKKVRILPILSINLLAITPILSSVSCSCYAELNLNEQQQYIYDRTFSIMCKKDTNYVFGTGWLISDATVSNPNDYTYWMATNWHVTHGFDNLGGSEFYYADASLRTFNDFVKYSNYKKFNKFNVEASSKFIYDGAITTDWTPAIDLAVIKVDFGSPSGQILTKLNKINNFQKQNGYINKFAKDSAEIRLKNKIIGGYPMKKSGSNFGGQWETHSFSGLLLNFCTKGKKYDGLNSGHAIGNPFYNQDGSIRKSGSEDFNIWDVSPQYMFSKNVNSDFMSGGASGSMMITEDYEVCGIYWGGWEIKSKFYPSFSLFNTDEKNFLKDYTK